MIAQNAVQDLFCMLLARKPSSESSIVPCPSSLCANYASLGLSTQAPERITSGTHNGWYKTYELTSENTGYSRPIIGQTAESSTWRMNIDLSNSSASNNEAITFGQNSSNNSWTVTHFILFNDTQQPGDSSVIIEGGSRISNNMVLYGNLTSSTQEGTPVSVTIPSQSVPIFTQNNFKISLVTSYA